jgi:hypothetical protein
VSHTVHISTCHNDKIRGGRGGGILVGAEFTTFESSKCKQETELKGAEQGWAGLGWAGPGWLGAGLGMTLG